MAEFNMSRKAFVDSLRQRWNEKNGITEQDEKSPLMTRSELITSLKRRTGQKTGLKINQSEENTVASDVAALWKRLGRTEGEPERVTTDYINSFMKDAQSFTKQAYDDYQVLDWTGATDQAQYDSRLAAMQELESRAAAVRTYLNTNKSRMDQETISSYTAFLDDFEEDRKQIYNAYTGAKDYYSQWGSQEAYDSYETARATYDEKSKADLSKLTAELGNMEAQVEHARQIQAQIGAFNPYAYADSSSAIAAEKKLKDKLAEITAPWGGMEGMEAAYSEKQQYYTTAKRIQDGKKLEEAASNEDFAAMSGYQSTELDNWLEKVFSQYGLGYGDVTHEYINADRKRREEILLEYSKFAGEQTDLDKYLVFDNMTATEIGLYNYYYNKEGKEKAQEYLDHLAESLNYRMAEQSFSRYQGNALAEILLGIEVGADQFRAGMKGLWNAITGNEEYIPASSTQILGGFVREDLENGGWNLPEWAGGASLGQMAYDLLSTTTNMVPSLAVSGVVGAINPTAGAAVGAGLLGASAAGNAYTEMINQGFSKQQARTYSALVGSSEAGLSYLLGGIGKLGGKLSGNVIGKIVSKVDNIFGKVAVKLGGTMLSEGMEEGLQEVLTPWFKQIATNIEQDVNWEEVAYSSLLGALSGVLMEGPGAVQSARSGTNAPAPLTENEQAVVDKVYEDRIAEEGKDGKKVTQKRKREIYDQVLEDLENGGISTDTIEEVLGGETHKRYRDTVSSEDSRAEALEKQIKELENAPNTVGNSRKYDSLQSQLEELKKKSSRDQLKTQLSQEVSELVKSDRLSESYAEKGRRSEKFQADLSQYAEKQRATVQAAMDSGILNNTRRAHEFVDLVAKISADTGVAFNFADNKRLKESGFALDGVTVNGFVNDSGVTVNLNSAKALNTVVGHEITHVLEGSPELYSAMADTILEYAKTKGEYDSRLAQLTKLYEGKEGYTGEDAAAKIEKELVADLVGDYLFSDRAFVEKLSTENRNLFQKIWDEVKYLCRMATAGSKEARQLLKVKKTFEEVYRAETKKPTESGGVRYSVGQQGTAGQKSQYAYMKPFADQLADYQSGNINGDDALVVGATPDVLKEIGLVSLPMTINQKHVGDALNGTYKGTQQEKLDHTFTAQELATLPEKLADPVAIIYDKRTGKANPSESTIDVLVEMTVASGKQVLAAVQINGNGRINGIRIDTNKVSTVHGNTDTITRLVDAINENQKGNVAVFYINKGKTTKALQRTGNPIPSGLSNLDGFIHSITDPGSPVKMRISSVTESQQFKRWFGDWQNHPENASKVVNADGTPKVMYHGTRAENGDFYVFDATKAVKKGGLGLRAMGKGNYFTAKKLDGTERYGSRVIPVYLDIKKPYVYNGGNSFREQVTNELGLDPKIDDDALQQEMRNQGYDGVVQYDANGDISIAVTFDSNQIKSATDNIGTFDGSNPDIRYSLSEKVAEDIAPLPWAVRGEDVALEGVVLPMPEDIARMEAGEGVQTAQKQAQEQPGEEVGVEDYEGEEDYEETVEDRLEIRKRRLQYEVRQNEANREELTKRIEAEIAAMREEYDGLQNKNTKKANQLLRRIDNKSGQLMQRQAEYDKSIRDLQERIAKVEEKLQQDHTKENRLEKAYRKIEEEYQQAELELAKEYYKNRYALATELENRGKWLSDMAFDLYVEMVAHNKGETLSPRLKELTRTGKDWQEIKYALEDIKDSPEALSRNPTDTEMLVREILEKKYDTERRQLTAMEEDFNKKLAELQKEKEARKKKTTVAGKRKESSSKYLYEVAKIAGDISCWEDLPTGLHYKTQTLQRYLGDVVKTTGGKPDPEKAKALYEYTQGSYNHNEADMKRELNALFEKYRKMKINPQESTYIQILGEALQGTGDGVKTKATEQYANNYLAKHKDKIDEQKCRKVIEMARKDYDEVWARMNEVLREHGMEEVRYVQGYFPHFEDPQPKWWHKVFNIQPVKPQTELQQIRREAADATKTEVAGKTGSFKPSKKSQSYTKTRKGPETDFNFLKGYETYMTGALDWIYHIPDIQRMRALENYIRIQHAQNNEVMARKIKEIQESDAYNADEEQLQLDLIFQQAKQNKLSNLVIDLMNRTNNLAGKRTGGDRTVEELLNPDAAKVLQQISGRNAANLVAGSISAASSNFMALTRAIGGTSFRSMGSAIWDYTFHNKEVDAVDKSDFLTNRLRNPDKLQKGFWDNTSDVVGWLGEWTDGFTSRVIWDARYKDNVQMRMSTEAAIKDADAFAESVLAGRSRGNMPTLFNSKNIVTKCFTTCQLEVANDYGFLFKDLPRDERIRKTNRLAAAYTKIAISTALLTALFYEPLTGRSPGFDPLGMVLGLIFGLADDEEEPKDAVLDFLEEGLQNVPFIGGLMGGGRVPLSSALPYDGIWGAVEGFTKDVASGDWKSVWEEMSNPLYYLVSPMGGGQLRKTAQGLGMYFNEVPGSYTADGRLRYTVEDEGWKGVWERIQAGVFGKWANENAQQYIEEGRSPLSLKQTQEFFDVGMTMQEYWDYRDEMAKLKKQDEKLQYINGMEITDEQKKVLKSYLFDEEGYAEENPEKYAFLEEEGIGYIGWKELPDDEQQAWSWAYDYPDKAVMGDVFSGGVVEYRKYAKAISELEADKDEDGNSISGSKKEKVTDYINGLDLEYGERIILYVSVYSNTASRDAYGNDIVEYLNGRGDLEYSQIKAILEELGFTVSEDGNVTWD